jgi:hypothetical protein
MPGRLDKLVNRKLKSGSQKPRIGNSVLNSEVIIDG